MIVRLVLFSYLVQLALAASLPRYPIVRNLYNSNQRQYLPGSWQRSDLITRSKSTEIVTLLYQGPNKVGVTSSNVNTRFCPHSQSGLKKWRYASTWPGSVPLPGINRNTIVLPKNTKVYLEASAVKSTSDNPYPKIVIPESSELIFADQDIELHTLGITVNGKLRIGSETCRVRSKITITLYGKGNRVSSTQEDLDDYYLKAIVVKDKGVLDIHGIRYGSTWTRLALTAIKGDSKIVLQEPVNWEVGQRIVVTTTNFKDYRDWHRNEEREIAKVETVKYSGTEFAVITLSEPLSYDHYGGKEYQAEVGLLSRRIKIQGDGNSHPTDTSRVQCKTVFFKSGYPCENSYLTGYGGHVAIVGGEAEGRVSGTEFYRMGQTNIMGRYPFHFHLLGDNGSKSFLQDSSIHSSFFRCISIHGTNKSRVSRNVAYNIIGSCFYFEDAVEEENLVEYNLAAHIHMIGRPPRSGNQFIADVPSSDKLLVPSDVSAAGFYITNAYNTIIGNAASGGYAGFTFLNVPRPLGLHAANSYGVYPSSRPTLLFKGNSCHSNGIAWAHQACLYVGGELIHPFGDTSKYVYNPGRVLGGRGYTLFEDTKVFLANVGINHWGSSPEIRYFEAHDVGKSANVFGRALLQNVLVECRSAGFEHVEKHYGRFASLTEKRWWGGKMRGFAWYDTGQRHIITDIKFRNCNQPNTAVWEILTHSSIHVPEWMQATARVSYENVEESRIVRFSSLSSKVPSVSGMLANWMDYDGTASGMDGPTIMGSTLAGYWWFVDSKCRPNFAWNMVMCSTLSSRGIGSLSIEAFPMRSAGQDGMCGSARTPCPAVGYANRFGMLGPVEDGMRVTYNEKLTGIVGDGIGWHVSFIRGAPKNLVLSRVQLAAGNDFILAFPYPKGTFFSVYAQMCYSGSGCFKAFSKARDAVDFINAKGAKYHVDKDGNLFLFIRPQSWGRFSFDNPTARAFSRGGVSIPEMAWSTLEYHVRASCVADPELSDPSRQEEFCRLNDPVKIPGCKWHCAGSRCATSHDPKGEAMAFCADGGFESFNKVTPKPTQAPTEKPTKRPTDAPTPRPTRPPPTPRPTRAPTEKPTKRPTDAPTPRPTRPPPTPRPTRAPTEKPTKRPTDAPTPRPTRA